MAKSKKKVAVENAYLEAGENILKAPFFTEFLDATKDFTKDHKAKFLDLMVMSHILGQLYQCDLTFKDKNG